MLGYYHFLFLTINFVYKQHTKILILQFHSEV